MNRRLEDAIGLAQSRHATKPLQLVPIGSAPARATAAIDYRWLVARSQRTPDGTAAIEVAG